MFLWFYPFLTFSNYIQASQSTAPALRLHSFQINPTERVPSLLNKLMIVKKSKQVLMWGPSQHRRSGIRISPLMKPY